MLPEFLVLFLATSPDPAPAQSNTPVPAITAVTPSHCRPGESVLYSCPLSNGKAVSVCSTPGFIDTMEGNLVYRYGQLGKVELSYPENPAFDADAFQVERYTRPMPMATTDLRLRFERGGWTYTVYQTNHCEPKDLGATPTWETNEEDMDCSEASGLIVHHPEHSELRLSCSSPAQQTSQFLELVFLLEMVTH